MSLSVLLVDDNPSVMVVTRGLLGSLPLDFFIIVAKNGKNGLESFKNHDPDLVLSDINMPVMDGIQMLKEIRNLNPNVPVILMSGDDQDAEALKAIGMTKLLPKPFGMEELKTSIMEAMGQ